MKMRPTLLMLTAAAAGASVLANAASAADPASRTPENRLSASIKQDVAKRDQEAARRNRALELREQAAKAAEQRLQTSKGREERPDRSAPRDVEEERFTELARIYQSMRPARAAVVFEQLEMDVQVNVARRMRERSTALILANMAPQKAAALTMAMARLPQPKKQIPKS